MASIWSWCRTSGSYSASAGNRPTARPTIAPGESQVEITLIEDAGDTILTLRHTGIPDAFAELHASGWSHFLPLLATAAASSKEVTS